jgi:hypothetical protein
VAHDDNDVQEVRKSHGPSLDVAPCTFQQEAFMSEADVSQLMCQMRCHSMNASRAYPNFSIHGSNCVMQLSPILPVFPKTSGNVIITKSMGKILLEFAPLIEEEGPPPGMHQRTKTYAYSRSGKIVLSPEDVGTLLYHVPKEKLCQNQGTSVQTISLSYIRP